MNSVGGIASLFGAFFTLIPILLVVLALRWVRLIRVNSEIQVEQNKEIMALLKKIADKSNT